MSNKCIHFYLNFISLINICIIFLKRLSGKSLERFGLCIIAISLYLWRETNFSFLRKLFRHPFSSSSFVPHSLTVFTTSTYKAAVDDVTSASVVNYSVPRASTKC